MKKILLTVLAASVALSSFAQRAKTNVKSASFPEFTHIAAKTTATGDTAGYTHINFAADTIINYAVGTNHDSGYCVGTDAYGDKGFAERYDKVDTFVSVLGVIAEFGGKVNPATTKTVVFNCWSVGPKTVNSNFPSTHVYNSGMPNTSLASVTAPLTHLGIRSVATVSDTPKTFYFTTPSSQVVSFFVGYTIAYTPSALGGDTIGLKSTLDGERHISYYSTSGADTTINNINATQYSDNTWHDDAFDNFQIGNHLYIFPIVKLGLPNGVSGITKNNLTFFGNYPNPASASTNVKFTLAQGSDVTISISNISGQVVKTVKQTCNAGTEVININTEELPAGEYVYLLRTAEGDGFASKLSIVK